MKAYKGFNRDMTCRGFQFEEGKTYEHQGDAKLCKSGFHACQDPMDCLQYYDPCNSVYHEVEIDGVSDERGDDTKVVGKKIKIGARIGIDEMVKASVDLTFAACRDAENADAISRIRSRQAASGYGRRQAASGGESRQAISGIRSCQVASGDGSRQAASGEWSSQVAGGSMSIQVVSGDGSRQAASGSESSQAAEGYASRQAASGDGSRQAASGHDSIQVASGISSRQETTGKNCVMMSAGNGGRAKGKIGSWIVLTEWEQGEPNVVARRIDGKEVKEDTWYMAKGGKLVEAE